MAFGTQAGLTEQDSQAGQTDLLADGHSFSP